MNDIYIKQYFVSSDELWRSRKGQMILIIISSSSSSSSRRRRRRRRRRL